MKKLASSAVLALAAWIGAGSAFAQTYELRFSGAIDSITTTRLCDGCADDWPSYGIDPLHYNTTLFLSFGTAPPRTDNWTSDLGPFIAETHSINGFAELLPGSFKEPLPAPLVLPRDGLPATSTFNQSSGASEFRTKFTGVADPSVTTFGQSWSLTIANRWLTPSGEPLWISGIQLDGNVPWGLGSTVVDQPFNKASFVDMLNRSVGCADCFFFTSSAYRRYSDEGQILIGRGAATLLSVRELTSPVPEPSSMAMLLAGLAGLVMAGWLGGGAGPSGVAARLKRR